MISRTRSLPVPFSSAALNTSRSSLVTPSSDFSASDSIRLFFARSTSTSKHIGTNSSYSTTPSPFRSDSASSKFISFLLSPRSAFCSAARNSDGSRTPFPSASAESNAARSVASNSSRVIPLTNIISISSLRTFAAASCSSLASIFDLMAPTSSWNMGTNSW